MMSQFYFYFAGAVGVAGVAAGAVGVVATVVKIAVVLGGTAVK
jgi:hypothetical protein